MRRSRGPGIPRVLITSVLILFIVFVSGTCVALHAENVVLASTSLTAAIARAAGASEIRVLTPVETKHPPEYELTPSDLLKFEGEGFLQNHSGPGVKPRTFIKAVDGEVIVQAPAPGYPSTFFEGVFLGILEMCGVTTGKVVQVQSEEKGDPFTEFHITWAGAQSSAGYVAGSKPASIRSLHVA